MRKVSLINDDSSLQGSKRKLSQLSSGHSDKKSGGIFMENAATFTSRIIFFLILSPFLKKNLYILHKECQSNRLTETSWGSTLVHSHARVNSPWHQYILETAQLGTASQKAHGGPPDTKLTMGQQSALVAKNPTKRILGCVRSSAAGRGQTWSCLYSALVMPHPGAGPALGSPDTRDVDTLERV